MTEHEKLIGIETMKSRIEFFHHNRLKRVGMEWKIEHYRTNEWSRSEVINGYRELPENIVASRENSAEVYNPTSRPIPKTDAEMRQIVELNGAAVLMG